MPKPKPQNKPSKKGNDSTPTKKAKLVHRHRNGVHDKAYTALCRAINLSPFPGLTKALLSKHTFTDANKPHHLSR